MILPQLIVNGIIAGSIYALIASGFSLIYNIQKFFHIAHGAVYLVSAFIAYSFFTYLGLNLILSLIVTMMIAAFIGIAIDQVFYKPLRKQKGKEIGLLLVSFGVFILLESIILLIFGAEIRTFGLPITKGYEIFGAIITKMQIIILIVSFVLMVALYIFLKKTKTGKALRAVADDKDVASTLGINIEKATMVVFGIGSALAATAGVLIAMEQNLEHSMGFMALLKGVTASIVGGIGNVPASMLGGYFLGLVENLGIWYLPSGYKDAIAFIILIIFLLFKPKGLFGIKTREEVAG